MDPNGEEVSRILKELQENISALQIKVGALEAIVLKSEMARAEYSQLVDEQVDRLMREKSTGEKRTSGKGLEK